MSRAALAGLLAALAAATAAVAAESSYFEQRLALHRALRRLDADLARSDSATAVLQAICDRRRPGAKITATQVAEPADDGEEILAREDLGVGKDVPLKHRQVDLACGDQVLSRAQNWYRPDRLTPEMNRALEQTRTPFGVVVGPFHRRRLATTFLFEPLPGGWEQMPKADFDAMPSPPPLVLQHRAVLETADGPFSLVVETYTEEALEP